MASQWVHAKTVFDGERCIINGLNIWDFEWKPSGEYIHIEDPLYKQPFSFPVYQIYSREVKVIFAAGEFSNCVWGIYERK